MNKVYLAHDTDAQSPRNDQDGNLGTMVCFHGKYDLGDHHGMSMEAALKLEQSADIIALPIYLYDHSGLTISTKPFSCPWDSGKIGFIYITKAEVKKEYDVSRISTKLKEKVLHYLQNEVEIYDMYLTGDTWNIIVENDGVIVDTCGTFYGKQYAEQEMAHWV
jgi:hypothetical protein